jgi:hypothetical protein
MRRSIIYARCVSDTFTILTREVQLTPGRINARAVSLSLCVCVCVRARARARVCVCPRRPTGAHDLDITNLPAGMRLRSPNRMDVSICIEHSV